MVGCIDAHHLHFSDFALGERAHFKVAKNVSAINVARLIQSLAEVSGKTLIIFNLQEAIRSDAPDNRPSTIHDAHSAV
jgi:hypothetical protein